MVAEPPGERCASVVLSVRTISTTITERHYHGCISRPWKTNRNRPFVCLNFFFQGFGFNPPIALGLLLLAFTANAHAGQVTLAWDANTDPELGGYKLYYGQTSGNYTGNVDVGNQTTYTLTGLTAGQTYYFAVTAYDRLGKTKVLFQVRFKQRFPSPLSPQWPTSVPAPTTGTAALNVAFTDTSSGSVTAWNWNFGDGTTSTTKNPSHTYSASGTYSVSLTVTGPGRLEHRNQNQLHYRGGTCASGRLSPPAPRLAQHL